MNGIFFDLLAPVSIGFLIISVSLMLYSLKEYLKGKFKIFLKWMVSSITFLSGAAFFWIYAQFRNIPFKSEDYKIINFVIHIFIIISSICLIKMVFALKKLSKKHGKLLKGNE